MLDLIDEHRAAVRYDLFRHGVSLGWLGTRRLTWGDAIAVLTEQPPADSALARHLYPDQYDRNRESQVLEVIAVLLAQIRQLTINPESRSDIMPTSYEDLFTKVEEVVEAVGFKGAGLSLEEIDRLQGWSKGKRIDVPDDDENEVSRAP